MGEMFPGAVVYFGTSLNVWDLTSFRIGLSLYIIYFAIGAC